METLHITFTKEFILFSDSRESLNFQEAGFTTEDIKDKDDFDMEANEWVNEKYPYASYSLKIED